MPFPDVADPRTGRFIVFEGGEGAGKSTQARMLADFLRSAGYEVELTREPGGTAGADALRRLLVEDVPAEGWEVLSEALLHYAARNEHLRKVIAPALRSNRWVVCDRFADSTAAYQGCGLALPDEVLQTLRRLVVGDLEPDFVIVLDVTVEEGLQRVFRRSAMNHYEVLGTAFHERVREAFLRAARSNPRRYAIIDGNADVASVHGRIRELICDRLPVHRAGT